MKCLEYIQEALRIKSGANISTKPSNIYDDITKFLFEHIFTGKIIEQNFNVVENVVPHRFSLYLHTTGVNAKGNLKFEDIEEPLKKLNAEFDMFDDIMRLYNNDVDDDDPEKCLIQFLRYHSSKRLYHISCTKKLRDTILKYKNS